MGALLAVLSTYLLLRATEGDWLDRRFALGFLAAELMFVTDHYYAALLLPLHALIIFAWLAWRNLVRALAGAAVLLVLGSVAGAYGAYTILPRAVGPTSPRFLARRAPA